MAEPVLNIVVAIPCVEKVNASSENLADCSVTNEYLRASSVTGSPSVRVRTDPLIYLPGTLCSLDFLDTKSKEYCQ